jgi:hypothetical protein
MPIPMVLTSSDSFTGGMKYSRFGGPVFSGTVADNAGGSVPPPGAIALIQSTAALATQIITATGQPAVSAFVYIPQGTLGMTSSGTANIAASPPYTGIGAAIYYDGTRKKLSVFSTINGDWLSVTLSSS